MSDEPVCTWTVGQTNKLNAIFEGKFWGIEMPVNASLADLAKFQKVLEAIIMKAAQDAAPKDEVDAEEEKVEA